MAEEEQECDLPVQAVRLVHALETAEERLDGTETRTEDEVEREGRCAGEREQDGDAAENEDLASVDVLICGPPAMIASRS